MTEGFIGQLLRTASWRETTVGRSLLSFAQGSPLNEATHRLPDTGKLNIADYETFKQSSKTEFYEKWASIGKSKSDSVADFEKLRLLGCGSFGFVILSKHKKSGKIYALKCVDKDKVIQNVQLENLKTEKIVLQCIDYPFSIYSFQTLKGNNYIYFVLPLMECGDLYGHVRQFGKGREDCARFYASQVVLALEYLHYLDFVYRDLKTENILMDHTGYLKLADFGFTKQLKRNPRTYTLCGTPEYLAPEVILNRGYGKAVDWWATGCLIFELVAGQTPFVGDNVVRVCEKIVSRRYRTPKYFSIELKDLVDKLLQTDLTRRYGNLKKGAADIKDHKWLLPINWNAIVNRRVEPPYKPECPSLDVEEMKPMKLPKEDKPDKHVYEFTDF